jgi:signal transduction histidine kinase
MPRRAYQSQAYARALKARGIDIRVQVRDYGVGMAAASGIGLALVRSILDSHEGTVAATSEGLGQGSEFTVRLKLVP